MKRIACFALVLLLLFGVLGFSSCAGDTRSPVIQEWEAVVVKQKKEIDHACGYGSPWQSTGKRTDGEDIDALLDLCQKISLDTFIEGMPETVTWNIPHIEFYIHGEYNIKTSFTLYIYDDGLILLDMIKDDERFYAHSTAHSLTKEDFHAYF